MGQRLDQSKSLADYQVEGGNVLTLVGVPTGCTVEAWPEKTSSPAAAESEQINDEPGTLYTLFGGIFGVSAFVERCMDSWMGNPAAAA